MLLLAAGAALSEPGIRARLASFGELAPVVPPVLLVVASALLAIGLALRPRLEWAAHAGATELLGEHEGLVAALERLRRLQGVPADA